MRATKVRWYCLFVCVLAYSTDGTGQSRKVDVLGGPLVGPVTPNAPFSADAIMVVKMAFFNGERLEQTNTAKYYRDSAGRSRVEHGSPGATQSTSARSVPTIIDDKPGDHENVWLIQVLDAEAQKTHSLSRELVGLGMGGDGEHLTVAVGGRRFVCFEHAEGIHRFLRLPEEWLQRESLGTRHVEGIAAIGTRVTLTVPPSTLRTTGPASVAATIVDEQWAAPELGIVISARHEDSRYGTIEYRVANIRRAEPPSTLFAVPSDYSIESGSTTTRGERWWVHTPADLYRADGKLAR